MTNKNCELYKASRYYGGEQAEEYVSEFAATDFTSGVLWLLEQIEKKKLILVPGSNEMFAAGYEAGQDSVLKIARKICGKE